jgi:alpha-soluble NSF attachment protein
VGGQGKSGERVWRLTVFFPQLYKNAHNAYKMSKQWQEAGVAAQKMAECYHPHLNSKNEAASAFQSAATCFQKVNPAEAVVCLARAVELYVDEGRFQVAAKQEQQIGEWLEEMGDMEQAIPHYQTAADYFDGEGQASAAAKVKLKIADWCARNTQYARAIEIYETTAIAYLANNLLKWSAKELFFKAGLCHLASEDLVAGKRAVERYSDLDVTFSTQRECKLLLKLIEACEKYDSDLLTRHVKEYNALSPLDAWKTDLLLKVKNTVATQGGNDDLT